VSEAMVVTLDDLVQMGVEEELELRRKVERIREIGIQVRALEEERKAITATGFQLSGWSTLVQGRIDAELERLGVRR